MLEKSELQISERYFILNRLNGNTLLLFFMSGLLNSIRKLVLNHLKANILSDKTWVHKNDMQCIKVVHFPTEQKNLKPLLILVACYVTR